ncbi:MAG: hypothetical protein ISS16_01090 [Ignavibacteria bacterium]|nr:hypothetical protein [Ignavibacteria bacterium]
MFSIDENGNLKVLLFYRPNESDIFNYKMTTKLSTFENSLSTDYNDLNTTRETILYYKHKVINVDALFNSTYTVEFDSVIVNTSVSSADTSFNEYYNSNTKNQNNDKFLLYNLISDEEFTLTVSQNGDIREITGLMGNAFDSVYTNAELLSDLQKNIESILSQQFLFTPNEELMTESKWQRIEDTEFLIFPIRKNIFYTLKGVKEIQDNYMAFIREEYSADFLEKEKDDTNFRIILTASHFGGEGVIQFNISSGCLEKIERKSNVFLNMNIYSDNGDGTSRQRVEEEFLLERIE